MKSLIVLCMFLAIFSQKVAAQTFTNLDDSIIVDIYVNKIDMNHRVTYDEKGRPKSEIGTGDSSISLQEFRYDSTGKVSVDSYHFYLNRNGHYYCPCNKLDYDYYVEKFGASVGN